jgi:hypothetical protein
MSPPLLLSIEPALTWPELGAICIGICDHLLGSSGSWVTTAERALEDRNGGSGCFHRERVREGATLTEHCASGSGNPRDGYGYDGTAALEVGERRVRVSFGSYQPPGGHLSLYFSGFTPAEFEAARAVVGGMVRLKKPGLWEAVTNIEAALALHDEPAAVRWLEGARDNGRPSWRARFFQLRAQLLGSTPEHTLRRLKETPSDRSAWLEAEQHPPPELPMALITQMVQRMCPVAPDLFAFARWRLFEGREPVEDFTPVGGPAIDGRWLKLVERPDFRPAHDIVKRMLSLDDQPGDYEHFSGSGYRGTLISRASWSEGAVHLWTEWKQGTVLPNHEQPHPMLFTEGVAERIHWSWIWPPSGEEDGVLVLIEQQGAPDRQEAIEENTPLRVFAWMCGTATFQERARAALDAEGRTWASGV